MTKQNNEMQLNNFIEICKKDKEFKEISNKIACELNKKIRFNIPYSVAYIIALILTLFGRFSPYNIKTFNKMTKNLTFSDDLARKTFNWNPTHVLERNII